MRPVLSGRRAAGRPVWLVTFTDLVALLLAFFVMLFATQKVETAKWAALVESLSRSLRPNDARPPDHRFATRNLGRKSVRRAIDLGYLELVLRDKIASDRGLHGVLLHRYDDRLVIALSADLLFPAAAATPSDEAEKTLFALAGILRNIGNRLEVFGHTDPSPVPVSLYRTNWELSIARALAVSRTLRTAGYHHDLPARGYAATRFPELRGVTPRELSYRLARRVDIVVHPTRWGVP